METNFDSVQFVTLPRIEISFGTAPFGLFLSKFLKAHIPLVRDAIHELTCSNPIQLAGFVVDMFCTVTTASTTASSTFATRSYGDSLL